MATGFKSGGRQKGSLNKDTKLLREMILQALDEQEGGGVEYLKRQAVESPTAFMTILGKVLPMQIGGDPDGSPIDVVAKINIVHVKPTNG